MASYLDECIKSMRTPTSRAVQLLAVALTGYVAGSSKTCKRLCEHIADKTSLAEAANHHKVVQPPIRHRASRTSSASSDSSTGGGGGGCKSSPWAAMLHLWIRVIMVRRQLCVLAHSLVMCLLIRSIDLERIWLWTREALLHVGSLVVPLCFTDGSLVVTWWFLGGLICGSFV